MRNFGHVCVAALIGVAGAVDFNRDIRPILSENCLFCHGPDKEHREADLRLDRREDALADRDGVRAVVPGDLAASEAWQRIVTDDPEELMPPPKSNKRLTVAQKDLLKAWIEEGAEWTEHWAFVPPVKRPVPDGVHPIDHFIRTRLAGHGLSPSPPAEPRVLARRLHLDLIGLPPTPEALRGFEAAHAKDPAGATTALIDQLLASQHYGERMALTWLDAARYGDTSVMHADGPRDMWPWRDWVVRAYNDNKPYDVFTVEQLAGDLLPEATVAQQIASGFNRNHATSDEGGAIAEELRVQYVTDRVRTTANVWMGLTMECAQCHEHKYDPISQEEYYQFYAFFNNHADPGMQTRRGNQSPVVNVVAEADHQRLAEVRGQIKTLDEAVKAARRGDADGLAEWRKPTGDAPGPEAAEPKDLKHLFSPEGVVDSVAVDLVSGKLGAVESRFGAAATNDARQAIKLNGKGSAVFGDFPDYDFRKQAFTFAAWLKVPAGANGAVFSDMDTKAKYRGYDMWLQGGAVGTHIINSWPNNAIKVVSAKPLRPDVWQHVVITYDGKGKADGVAIHVDGEAVETKVEQGKLSGSTKSSAPFRIGGRTPGANPSCDADDIRIYLRVLGAEEIRQVAGDPVARARATAQKERSGEQKRIVDESFLVNSAPYRDSVAKLAKARKEEKELLTGKTTSMVMADNPPDRARKTYMLDRGAYDAPRKDREITPGVPAVLPALAPEAPRDRLALARWLVREDHPLTARTAVNLVWQTLFGEGLVATPSDFGAQGAYPSHPELLDWLAVDFREHGWDIKRLVRLICESRTYQQSSRVTPELLAGDPDNLLLARAPRFRLQAELVRDNALAVSGLLNPAMGGPGVKPYQPPGLWAEVGLGGNPKFKQDSGDKLHRRGIYTYWKRSAPAPSMVLFDAPTREICTMKRPRTNTPLQALATMNDIQFVEAARHLAERMLRREGDDAARFAHGYELATGALPDAPTLDDLRGVHDRAMRVFGADEERARALLAVGESKRDESFVPAEHAAMTVVANVLLNLDQCLTRE